MDRKRPRDESDSDSSAVELGDLAALVARRGDDGSSSEESKGSESDDEENESGGAPRNYAAENGAAGEEGDFMSFASTRPVAAGAAAAQGDAPPWLDAPWNGRTPPLVALHNEILVRALCAMQLRVRAHMHSRRERFQSGACERRARPPPLKPLL